MSRPPSLQLVYKKAGKMKLENVIYSDVDNLTLKTTKGENYGTVQMRSSTERTCS